MLIKSVKISNYRTIKQTEVDFLPGLNIIIGNNGSGKTNFLSVVNSLLQARSVRTFSKFSGKLIFDTGLMLEMSNIPASTASDLVNNSDTVKIDLIDPVTDSKISINKKSDIGHHLDTTNQRRYLSGVIPHGFPNRALFLNVPFSGSMVIADTENTFGKFVELFHINPNEAYECAFVDYLRIGLAEIAEQKFDTNLEKTWSAFLQKSCAYFSNYLKRCTPVESMRLSDSFAVDYENDRVNVSNLYFEFYQNNRWNNYQELSDGTKRLVTILLNIADFRGFVEEYASLDLGSSNTDTIIIIEEPELGINPHQLYKLMLLLKDEAENKQIILTTHSPIALDALDRNEIDSILICEYDNEKGTQVRKLTNREKNKAKAYMDEVGYLSLYWTHSDLQKID